MSEKQNKSHTNKQFAAIKLTLYRGCNVALKEIGILAALDISLAAMRRSSDRNSGCAFICDLFRSVMRNITVFKKRPNFLNSAPTSTERAAAAERSSVCFVKQLKCLCKIFSKKQQEKGKRTSSSSFFFFHWHYSPL
jgi:hypothetical protein